MVRSFQLWLNDTYEEIALNKDSTIQEVWRNLDGTRSSQYALSISLPGGFQDRIFSTWITWEITEVLGCPTFIIAYASMDVYSGTHHSFSGAEYMTKATARGAHIIRKLTENTCEWTRVQQVDLRMSGVPNRILDFLAKRQLELSNKLQKKFRRNGREVDRERVHAVVDAMTRRRGMPLIEDQRAVFERCEAVRSDEHQYN